MIVVDTSAIVAILRGEPERDALVSAITTADERLVSAGTLIELGIVVEASTGGRTPLERVIADFDLTIVEVDEPQIRAAMSAWRRFGKGRHPAGLNFGDCFAYALADTRRLPLLFVGEDFARTDIMGVSN